MEVAKSVFKGTQKLEEISEIIIFYQGFSWWGGMGGITPEEKIPPHLGFKTEIPPPSGFVTPPLNLKIFGALRAQIYASDCHSYNT